MVVYVLHLVINYKNMGNTPSNGNDNDEDVKGVATPDILTPKWKIDEVKWDVLLESVKLLEGPNSKEKKEVPEISQKMQRYLEAHNILELNKSQCISLIKQIWEYVFSKKLESRGKNLKTEIEELLRNDSELIILVMNLISIDYSPNVIYLYNDLIPIIVEILEYEKRLVGQYRRNKSELLEKLKKSPNINVWWDKSSNNIASLTVEELTEIFSLAENATRFDISSYDLDLLSEEQLTAIFGKFKNIKIADLSGAIFPTLWKTKKEIIFSNLAKCETLIFWENNVTDEILDLMGRYLKNIKSIDFTMCELTQEQKDFLKDKFPDADICIDEEEDVNPE